MICVKCKKNDGVKFPMFMYKLPNAINAPLMKFALKSPLCEECATDKLLTACLCDANIEMIQGEMEADGFKNFDRKNLSVAYAYFSDNPKGN